jgi:hypothetical protein
MGRRILRTLIVLGTASAALAQGVGKAKPADATKPAVTLRELTSEYELAREPHFYFVLDVRNRNLELRVKGMVLRAWKLKSMRFWGKPAFSTTVELVKKSALKPPRRNIIKPGEGAATPSDPTKFELEALELKDMPMTFGLDFSNGLHITVTAKKKGLSALRDSLMWYVWEPVRSYFKARDGKPVSILELRFEKESDAQAIYWTFFEGIKGLVD